MAQCPISPQLTSNCSPLHATMRHAISLPHTGSSELLIVFLFIFSIPPSPREWVWRYAMFRKIGRYRRSGEREKSMKQLSGVLAFYWFSGEQTQGVSPYNFQRPGTWNTHRYLIRDQQKVNTDRHVQTGAGCICELTYQCLWGFKNNNPSAVFWQNLKIAYFYCTPHNTEKNKHKQHLKQQQQKQKQIKQPWQSKERKNSIVCYLETTNLMKIKALYIHLPYFGLKRMRISENCFKNCFDIRFGDQLCW